MAATWNDARTTWSDLNVSWVGSTIVITPPTPTTPSSEVIAAVHAGMSGFGAGVRFHHYGKK